MPTSIYFWVEVFTLIVCLYCYRKFNLLRYKLFLPYLFIIVLYELGNIYQLLSINRSNAWITNFELLFEYIFYCYFILSTYQLRKQKNWLLLIFFVCLVFSLIDIFFIEGVMQLGTIAIVIQYLVLITLVCRFFYMKMKNSDNPSLIDDPDFWVHTGLLFFFLAGFLLFASYTHMAYKKLSAYHVLFTVISNVANLILYSCLSFSFVCFRRMTKISY